MSQNSKGLWRFQDGEPAKEVTIGCAQEKLVAPITAYVNRCKGLIPPSGQDIDENHYPTFYKLVSRYEELE